MPGTDGGDHHTLLQSDTFLTVTYLLDQHAVPILKNAEFQLQHVKYAVAPRSVRARLQNG